MGDIDDYRIWLVASGASARTVESRTMAIRALAFRAERPPDQVTTMDVMRWIASVPSIWSKTTYYGHARSWARYLAATGRDGSWIDGVPKPKARKGVPRPADIMLIAQAITHAAHSPAHMMLLLAVFQGLRVSEIAAVRGQDVAEDIMYVLGKGGSQAMLPTHPHVWAAAERYPRRGWWFPSPDGARPVSRQTVWRQMTDALRAVGCDSTPHQVRHTYGTELLDGGANIRVVQVLMRHSSLSSTQVYTRVRDMDCRRAVLRLHLPDSPDTPHDCSAHSRDDTRLSCRTVDPRT